MTIHKFVGKSVHLRHLVEVHETKELIVFIFDFIEGISLTELINK